jgi:C4-type Zn-finger protein
MEDLTKGFDKGESCPKCKDRLVIIRNTTDDTGKASQKYACCTRCSWRTLDYFKKHQI